MSRFIVGLCGAHGTGKSTVIGQLEKIGVPVSNTSLSRAAQKELGWDSLDRAQESESNMWDLQEAVLGAMWDRDTAIQASQVLTIVDRTPADVWGYTALWASRIGSVDSERLRKFKARCRDMADRYELFVIFPIRTEILFIPETNRADVHSREFHDREVREFIASGLLPSYEMKSLGIHCREDEIIAAANIKEHSWKLK